MMTNTRIYGYLGDGYAVCTGCYNETEDGRPGGDEGLRPLYSIDDDGYGLSCDGCLEYIFEPELEEVEQ